MEFCKAVVGEESTLLFGKRSYNRAILVVVIILQTHNRLKAQPLVFTSNSPSL